MKKSLFIIATTALVISCASNDVKNDIIESNVEIGFAAETYKATRAEITSNANLATAGGFVVWGYKAKNQATMDWTVEPYTVFDGVNVYVKDGQDGAYISGTETDWTYATKKYWDKGASYCFYAVAPNGGSYSIAGATNNVKRITITGAAYGDASAAATKDYLISRAGVIDRKGTNQANVDFIFNHTMAKVDFLLKKGDNVAGEVKVQSIDMTGWDVVVRKVEVEVVELEHGHAVYDFQKVLLRQEISRNVHHQSPILEPWSIVHHHRRHRPPGIRDKDIRFDG